MCSRGGDAPSCDRLYAQIHHRRITTTWEQIREQYPGRWVLIEATEAHTEGGQRILDAITLIGDFDDSSAAWDAYRDLHVANREREFYPVHTSREALDIGVIDRFGRILS